MSAWYPSFFTRAHLSRPSLIFPLSTCCEKLHLGQLQFLSAKASCHAMSRIGDSVRRSHLTRARGRYSRSLAPSTTFPGTRITARRTASLSKRGRWAEGLRLGEAALCGSSACSPGWARNLQRVPRLPAPRAVQRRHRPAKVEARPPGVTLGQHRPPGLLPVRTRPRGHWRPLGPQHLSPRSQSAAAPAPISRRAWFRRCARTLRSGAD